jgi:hypothetical protein
LVAFVERRGAVKAVREQLVPSDGVGYVTVVDVRCEYRDQMSPTADGWLVPAADVGEFNAKIVSAIREEAEFRGPVPDSEFDDAHAVLGFTFPPAWRDFLQGSSWFRRGWLESGCYVWLYPPRDSVELHDAWDTSVPLHPGIAIIGGDGSREMLCLDLRDDPAPVVLVDITSDCWDDNPRQSDNVEILISRVEDGTFDFTW